PTYNGQPDAFLMRFSTGGGRVWGTYYGGEGSDRGFSISRLGNDLWISGITGSTTGIATPLAFQTASNGYDAFLVRFNDDGSALRPIIAADDPLPLQLISGRTLLLPQEVFDPVQVADLRVIDPLGRVVRTWSGVVQGSIALDGLPSGTYVVVVAQGGQRCAGRIAVP
ncbi:MAG TPA: T9SS type A sorting domain-containing protein, partial [Flavobacteriales bacterium]|nr:T9SS type A sorting domain-containing protein [Flavobacteriales bacterium]